MTTASSLSTSFVDTEELLDLERDVTDDACAVYRGCNSSGERTTAIPSMLPDRGRLGAEFFTRSVIFLKILWASPWSLWGSAIGVLGLLTGGSVQRSGRLVEFSGGLLPLFLKYFPFVAGSPVATFGHVVLGRCPRHLDACRPHQLIHMKQYECWGPLFVPTYILYWILLWYVGKRPYYDNPFEREAFEKTGW